MRCALCAVRLRCAMCMYAVLVECVWLSDANFAERVCVWMFMLLCVQGSKRACADNVCADSLCTKLDGWGQGCNSKG